MSTPQIIEPHDPHSVIELAMKTHHACATTHGTSPNATVRDHSVRLGENSTVGDPARSVSRELTLNSRVAPLADQIEDGAWSIPAARASNSTFFHVTMCGGARGP